MKDLSSILNPSLKVSGLNLPSTSLESTENMMLMSSRSTHPRAAFPTSRIPSHPPCLSPPPPLHPHPPHTEPIDTNLFRSRSLWKPPGARGVFGGQIIGQSLAAAHQTVDTALLQVHSLHSLFIRAGDCTIPVIYRVDRVRDGRSFCTRSVRGEREAAALSAVSTRQSMAGVHCSIAPHY